MIKFVEVDLSNEESCKRFIVFERHPYENEFAGLSFDTLDAAKEYIVEQAMYQVDYRVFDCDLRKDVYAGCFADVIPPGTCINCERREATVEVGGEKLSCKTCAGMV